MALRKYLRRNMYRWHRISSLIIALPVMLWAISGFMHPLMTNIRPNVATQKLTAPLLDTAKIKVSLTGALQKNHVDTFSSFRLVNMNGNWFYQVKLPGTAMLKYYSTDRGKLLPQGDELYARYLAKQFLEGDEQAAAAAKGQQMLASLKPEPMEHLPTTDAAAALNGDHDCCSNTMASILNVSKGAKVTAVQMVESFNGEYKYVNRLLPAWKVTFDRADGIRIYVETAQDRFAYAVDDKRAAFDTFFSLFHTLGWLDFMERGKHVVEMLVMLLALFTTVMGLYMFFTTKTKQARGNMTARARRTHRITSLTASLFTLLFTFSGGWHALEKLTPDTRDQYFADNHFPVAVGSPDIARIQAAIGTGKLISNISLVKMDDANYWQVYGPIKWYVRTTDYALLPSGEERYARYLASLFSQRDSSRIISTTMVAKFVDEYGFVNKRLPVWKVGYAENSRERYYVETSSGRLAALVNDKDLYEGYSFALFHKHHFMDWGGKTVRDISTMFWAFMQVLMISVGLWFWMKVRRKAY